MVLGNTLGPRVRVGVVTLKGSMTVHQSQTEKVRVELNISQANDNLSSTKMYSYILGTHVNVNHTVIIVDTFLVSCPKVWVRDSSRKISSLKRTA